MEPAALSSNRDFMADFLRAARKQISMRELRTKYRLSAGALREYAEDPAFLDAVRAEHRSGNGHVITDELVVDLCRFAEGVLTEKQVRKKHRLLNEDAWEKMGSDDSLLERIEDEKIRRIRSGASKREKAQLHIVRGPDILNAIASDSSANNRHRVDALKVLDGMAANGSENAPTMDRFVIRIDLGGDVETYDKSIQIGVEDATPDAGGVVVALPKKTKKKLLKVDDGEEHL
jgi:hypothetical protein